MLSTSSGHTEVEKCRKPELDILNEFGLEMLSPITTYLNMFIVVIGCIGTLTLITHYYYDQNRLRNRFSQHLAALCCWDATLLVASALALWTAGGTDQDGAGWLTNGRILSWQDSPVRVQPSAQLALFASAVAKTAHMGSTWQLVFIAAERYTAVTNPLEHLSKKRSSAKWSTVGVLLITVFLNIPRHYLEYRSTVCIENGTSAELSHIGCLVHPAVKRSDLTGNPFYQLPCHFGIDLLTMWVVPPLLLFTFSYRTLKVRRRSSMSSMLESSHELHKIPGSCIAWFASMLWCRGVVRPREPSLLEPPSPPHESDLSLRHSKRIASNHQTTSFLLLFLNVKLFIANGALVLVILCDLLLDGFYSSVYRSCLSIITDCLVITHCATNWIVFMNWNRRISTLNKKAVVPRYQILTKKELNRLNFLWTSCLEEDDRKKIGVDMVIATMLNNEELCKRMGIYKNWDSLDVEKKKRMFLTNRRVWVAGKRITEFIDQALTELTTKPCSEEAIVVIRQQLREIGQIHYITRVNLLNNDWLAMKREMIYQLLEVYYPHKVTASSTRRQEGRVLYHLLSTHFQNDTEIVNKFVSFVIRELKCGFMCEGIDAERDRAHRSSSVPKITTSTSSSTSFYSSVYRRPPVPTQPNLQMRHVRSTMWYDKQLPEID